MSHDKRNGKWYASICHRGAKEQLGAFDEEEDARGPTTARESGTARRP